MISDDDSGSTRSSGVPLISSRLDHTDPSSVPDTFSHPDHTDPSGAPDTFNHFDHTDSSGAPDSFSRPIRIRVALPAHLRNLAGLPRGASEVELLVSRVSHPDRDEGTVTISGLLDALEGTYPMLRGTIRGHHRGPRRPHMRYFGDGRDLSFHSDTDPLPDPIVQGREPFVVIGAISGG